MPHMILLLNIFIQYSFALIKINNTETQQFFPFMVVGSNNITIIQAENPYLLITFFQYNCPHSKHFLEKEFKPLIIQGEEHNIIFGIYNTMGNSQQILQEYDIIETPTLILFINEVPNKYFGNRKPQQIMEWILTLLKGNSGATEIIFEEQFNQFLDDNKIVLFYQRNVTSDFDQNFEKFYQYAIQNEDKEIAFAYSTLYQINKPYSLHYYKREAQEDFAFSSLFTLEQIKIFIDKYKLPQIPKLNSESEDLVFKSNKLSFILFNSLDESSIQTEQAFQQVANMFQNFYQFSYTNFGDEQFKEYLIDLGADNGIFPKIIALKGKVKYLYTGPGFSVDEIKSFIQNIKQGNVNPYLASDPIDENSNSFVKKIVGLNYDEQVKKSKKNVLLKYYVKGCQGCLEIEPIFEQLAFNYRDDQNLLIAEIDIRTNDFTDVFLPRQIPDIILFIYKDGERTAKYWNNRDITIDKLEQFIEYNTKKVDL